MLLIIIMSVVLFLTKDKKARLFLGIGILAYMFLRGYFGL